MNASKQTGVTLVEMLVVLAMIGAVAGMTVAVLGGSERRNGIDAEAQRLASRLNLAVDEALVTGAPLVLRWDDSSYRFDHWNADEGAWQPYDVDLLGQAHHLPPALRLEAERRPDQAQRLAILPGGAGEPLLLAIAGTPRAWRVVFDGLTASTLAPED